jgi:hypothetical protein
MEDNSIKKVNKFLLKDISNLGYNYRQDYSLRDMPLTINFNFSFKEWFDLRRGMGFSPLYDQFGEYYSPITYEFTDLRVSVYKAKSGKDLYRTVSVNGISFNISTIDHFCGGFQISAFSGTIEKERLTFTLRFMLEEYFGKSGSYGKSAEYPIYFFDREDDRGRIKLSLGNSSLKGKLTQLYSYINPNSNQKVGVYMYQFEN